MTNFRSGTTSGGRSVEEIAGYFDNGQSPKNSNFYNKLEVRRVWKLERIGKKDNFDDYAKKITKKKGATGIVRGWHGTRTENLMGISKSGLLMPEHLPKGVHVTGKAFGKGIYAAPCWSDAGKNRKGDDSRSDDGTRSASPAIASGIVWNVSKDAWRY